MSKSRNDKARKEKRKEVADGVREPDQRQAWFEDKSGKWVPVRA